MPPSHPRRSVWLSESPPEHSPTPPSGDRWGTPPPELPFEGTAPVSPPGRPPSMLDKIRVAEPRPEPKRTRTWEKQHPSKTYRKVPTEIRTAVTRVADETDFTASQIAQVFLEYALYCYARGDFQLEVGLGKRGTTLFPGGWGQDKKPVWAEKTWGKIPPEKKRRRKSEPSLRGQMATYRLSVELVAELERICVPYQVGNRTEYTYHVGEVLARFLAFSIDAYTHGALFLQGVENE